MDTNETSNLRSWAIGFTFYYMVLLMLYVSHTDASDLKQFQFDSEDILDEEGSRNSKAKFLEVIILDQYYLLEFVMVTSAIRFHLCVDLDVEDIR